MSLLARMQARDIAQQIHSAVKAGDLALPPLPQVATRLLAQIRNEEKADLGQISRLMLNDAAITASLLRVANSATFAGLAAVSDLDQAVGRLGLRQVGATVTALAHRGLFRTPSPERTEMLRGMWDHALASAITTRTLAESEGADAVESYLAGLLHDTGKLLVLKGIDDLEQRSGTTRLKPETVVELMEALHGELGCGVLRAWRIAEPICRVTLHHHDHLVATDDRLLLRVQASDAVANLMTEGPTEGTAGPPPPAFGVLGIGESELIELRASVEAELVEARDLLL